MGLLNVRAHAHEHAQVQTGTCIYDVDIRTCEHTAVQIPTHSPTLMHMMQERTHEYPSTCYWIESTSKRTTHGQSGVPLDAQNHSQMFPAACATCKLVRKQHAVSRGTRSAIKVCFGFLAGLTSEHPIPRSSTLGLGLGGMREALTIY